MDKSLPSWMKELSEEKNNADFSMLCHQYFKLATMRVMQEIREKHKVPPEDIGTLTMSIFARFLNEAVYATGAFIKNGMKLHEIFDKDHLNNLLKVLNGDPLDPSKREDVETDLKLGMEKFKAFVSENASDFYTEK